MTPEEMLIRAEVAMEWRKEVARAVAAERERCAKIAESLPEFSPEYIADAIREERERCAKIAEDAFLGLDHAQGERVVALYRLIVADAIRKGE
jgi:hypothetical protein